MYWVQSRSFILTRWFLLVWSFSPAKNNPDLTSLDIFHWFGYCDVFIAHRYGQMFLICQYNIFCFDWGECYVINGEVSSIGFDKCTLFTRWIPSSDQVTSVGTSPTLLPCVNSYTTLRILHLAINVLANIWIYPVAHTYIHTKSFFYS